MGVYAGETDESKLSLSRFGVSLLDLRNFQDCNMLELPVTETTTCVSSLLFSKVPGSGETLVVGTKS